MSIVRKERSTVHFAKRTNTLSKLTHLYRPDLHRQMTERVPVSRLGHELTLLCQAGLGEALDAGNLAQAKLELTESLDKMMPSVKRNKVGLDVRSPIILHCFPHWHVTLDTLVVCLLPVAFPKIKVTQCSIDHAALELPPIPKDGFQGNTSSTCSQRVADIRSTDGVHLCPKKLNEVCIKLMHKSLLKQGVADDKICVSVSACDLSMTLLLDCGWRAELVPCVVIPQAGDNEYYVSRQFRTDLDEHEGDSTWTPCSSVKDQNLLHSISSTDDGLRVKAMYIVCKLLSHDWRLNHITCYHLQTTLLHNMDFHVDYSPRWQRCTLEFCVRSLLKTLLYFLGRGTLPHFDLDQMNLWKNMTHRQLTLAHGAVTRLLTNETALISLIRRASKDATCADFGLLYLT